MSRSDDDFAPIDPPTVMSTGEEPYGSSRGQSIRASERDAEAAAPRKGRGFVKTVAALAVIGAVAGSVVMVKGNPELMAAITGSPSPSEAPGMSAATMADVPAPAATAVAPDDSLKVSVSTRAAAPAATPAIEAPIVAATAAPTPAAAAAVGATAAAESARQAASLATPTIASMIESMKDEIIAAIKGLRDDLTALASDVKGLRTEVASMREENKVVRARPVQQPRPRPAQSAAAPAPTPAPAAVAASRSAPEAEAVAQANARRVLSVDIWDGQPSTVVRDTTGEVRYMRPGDQIGRSTLRAADPRSQSVAFERDTGDVVQVRSSMAEAR